MINGITIMKEHFPERSKKILLVNTNSIVRILFDSIKYLLDDRIQKKIDFIDDLSTLSENGLENIKVYVENINYDNIQLNHYNIVNS